MLPGRLMAQSAVRSLITVVLAPLLDDHLCLLETAEGLPVEALGERLVVEPSAARRTTEGWSEAQNKVSQPFDVPVPPVALRGRFHHPDDIARRDRPGHMRGVLFLKRAQPARFADVHATILALPPVVGLHADVGPSGSFHQS